MKRIGIYGGSFNPIHNGHVAIARAMLHLAALDEVWLVVSPHNPLKPSGTLLDDDKRLTMARTATDGIQGIRVSDCEFNLPRPSYMWNTLQHLSQTHPDCEFTLLIGADNWAVFNRWFRADDIIANYRIAIYPRSGSPIDEANLPSGVQLYDTGLYDISSTQVRQRIAEGLDISQLVPASIACLARQFYSSKP